MPRARPSGRTWRCVRVGGQARPAAAVAAHKAVRIELLGPLQGKGLGQAAAFPHGISLCSSCAEHPRSFSLLCVPCFSGHITPSLQALDRSIVVVLICTRGAPACLNLPPRPACLPAAGRPAQAAGLVLKAEPYQMRVPRSQRGGEIVEPLVREQWFVRMEPLAKPALEVGGRGSRAGRPGGMGGAASCVHALCGSGAGSF